MDLKNDLNMKSQVLIVRELIATTLGGILAVIYIIATQRSGVIVYCMLSDYLNLSNF